MSKLGITLALISSQALMAMLPGATPKAFAAEEAKASIKLGGGALYNSETALRQAIGGKAQGGGRLAIDFQAPGRRLAFSPTVDIYRKSGVTSVWSGLNFLLKSPGRGDKGSVYFGAGGGVLHTQIGSVAGSAVTRSSVNRGSFDVLVGTEIKASERVSIFIEPRYVWAASSALNGVAAHAGLAFHVR